MRYGRRRFFLAVFALLGGSHTHAEHTTSPVPPSGPASHETCAIDPTAIVSDACASFSTLDQLNTILQPSIRSLTQNSDFFSYYRLNLYNKVCPFWSDESSMCGNIACAVHTIENEEDIPKTWRAAELGKLEGPKATHPDRKLQQETKPLMGKLGEDVGESCVVEYDDECDERDYCVPEDESATSKGDYVSLVENPERFTGYSGPGAQQVWEAIYRENCFTPDGGVAASPAASFNNLDPFGSSASQQKAEQDLRKVMTEIDMTDDAGYCLEKRVFYRIISGMHTSISTHLCYDYLNQTTGEWGPNLSCYVSRLHEHTDRISNLYFNYALVLRAIEKVTPALQSYTFCSGDPPQDASTKRDVLRLAEQISSSPRIYDESLMFADTTVSSAALKGDFRARFRNVSRTMDCVGCDKCRLWGKLQTAGYGTALKILFEFDDKDPSHNPPLRRTELVALVNTLDKISSSLSALSRFEEMLEQEIAPPSSATEVEDVEDDGFGHVEEPPKPLQTKSQLRLEFEREFGEVWHVTKWVLKRYLAIPGEIGQLFFTELVRLWNIWLGIPGATWKRRVGWDIQYPPPRDEV